MNGKEFSQKAAEVLTKLESPEDVGGLLESMITGFSEKETAAEKLTKENADLSAKIDRLQRANMELFLRTGASGGDDGDGLPDDIAGDDDKAEKLSPDFSAAMDDKGNIL